MSKRTERREADREARKLAFLELRLERAQPATAEAPIISELQLAANRANAQLSSGPKSSEGKAKSCMNALKHGLTSQTVILAGEDLVKYNRQFDSYIARLQPVGEEELRLVQSLLDSTWRVNRILRMESCIYLKGHAEFESKFEDRDPAEREGFIQTEVFLKYEKSLRNLQMQEARLRRCHENDKVELMRLQTLRQRVECMAAESEQPSRPQPRIKAPAKNGFVFSTVQTPLADPLLETA